jgi:hypothetical protein
MKNILSLTVLCLLFFYGCKKEDLSVLKPSAGIEGTWNYIGYSGGLAGQRFTPVAPGGVYIQINDMKLLITSGDNGQQKSMQYQFQADTSHNSHYQLSGLLAASDTSYMLPMPDMKIYFVALHNDTLTLYPTLGGDCYTSHYVQSLKHFTCSDSLH